MKTILMMATALMLSVTASAEVNPGNGDEVTTVEATTVTMTFAELKAMYGAENIDISGVETLTDMTVISFTTVPGGPCAGEQPCGAALAQARFAARQLANECCCVQISGVECCDQGALKAILFIVLPNSPSCN